MNALSEGEQRLEPRKLRDDTLHIQVLRQHPGQTGTELVLHANTRDVSASGFNAIANMALPIGSLLDVVVELHDNGAPFLLTAEVRWCDPTTQGGFQAGFALQDATGSDYRAWQQRFGTQTAAVG